MAYQPSGSVSLVGGTLNFAEDGSSLSLFATAATSGLYAYLEPDAVSGTDVIFSDIPSLTIVASGFLTSGGTVADGAQLWVLSGGVASAVEMQSGGVAVLSPGGLGSGLVLSGGSGLVLGLSEAALVESGGTETIAGGGTALASQVLSGGLEVIGSGGVASGTTVGATGEAISSGGVARKALVSFGSTEVVIGGVADASTVSNGGVEIVGSGGVASGTIVEGAGTQIIQSGGTALGGSIGGTVDFATGAVVKGDLYFTGATAQLGIGGTVMPTATLHGFHGGHQIDLHDVAYSSDGSVSYDSSTDLLTIQESGAVETLQLAGDYTGASFTLAADAGSGTLLTVSNVPCFAEGTRILTPKGLVAVEALAIGDLVTIADGTPLPATWIGHRTVDCRHHPDLTAVWPVRVRANAFGSGKPCRDLRLSPDHAIYAEGVLVPVKHLLTPGVIEQETVGRITYWHVELPRHEVILAEGLETESYLDTGDRMSFANGGAALALHPAWGSAARDITLLMEAQGYAPLRVTGPEVERLRQRLRPSREALSGCRAAGGSGKLRA